MPANHYAYIRREVQRQVQSELRSERIIRRNAMRLYGGAFLAVFAVGGMIGWAVAHLIA